MENTTQYKFSPEVISLLKNAPLVACFFAQASGISPILSILKNKRTDSLSPFPFISLYANCAMWLLYGYLGGDWTVINSNIAGFILGLIYTAIFAKYTNMSMKKYYIGSILFLLPMLTCPYWLQNKHYELQLLGSVGCICAVILMASPLVTIGSVVKEQSTQSMPFIVSLAMLMNGISWAAYGWYIANDKYIYIPNILGTMAGLIQLSLFVIYPSKPKAKEM